MFKQLWYDKSKLKFYLKLTRSKRCSNLLHIKNLMYYDYKIYNLTTHKYILGLHKVEIFKKSIFHLYVAHFCKIEHFMQVIFLYST